jgi:hypothetical protein
VGSRGRDVAVSEDRVAFLAKPFTADQLARRVREVLDVGD